VWKPVWKELGMESIRCTLEMLQSAKEVVRVVMGMKKEERMRVIVLLRQWWLELERNRIREG
jgi:hypothetical protein